MAEPLGEQPTGSEGSSRPALRTYFVGAYFTGTPVNISELSGGCRGGERERARSSPRRRSDPSWADYTRCGSFNMRPSSASSRLVTETFQEKSVRQPPKSSSAWPYFSILQSE